MVVEGDDPRLAKVGFAKLEGQGIEFYAKKYEIIIGRPSKAFTPDVVISKGPVLSATSGTRLPHYEQHAFLLTTTLVTNCFLFYSPCPSLLLCKTPPYGFSCPYTGLKY